jgi:surface antigen
MTSALRHPQSTPSAATTLKIAMPRDSQRMARRRSRIRNVLVSAGIVLLAACSHPSETAKSPVKAPISGVVKNRPSDPDVRAAQEALAELGYYRGPIDGITGPKTRAAVAKFQTDLGLPPDGKVSRELVAQVARARQPGHDAQVDPTMGPLYETGDVYIYTDGAIETVVSVSGHRVEWKNAVGSSWSSARDFTLPTNLLDNGAITAHHPLAWPLNVGATSGYTVVAPIANAAKPDHKIWQCTVRGRERTSVAAGTFDTYKIVCQLDTGTSNRTQSRTWYFASAIGHYVRYIDDAAALSSDVTGTRSRDLVGVSPSVSGWPSEARIGREWAVSHALEAEPPGQAVPWESSAIAARFVIKPGRKVNLDNSGQCRQFTAIRTAADGARRLYPGVACRQPGGRWQVVGLDGTLSALH